MKHFYILTVSFLLSLSTVYAQDCSVAVETIQDDFESYEAGGNLAGCWTAIKTGSMVSGIRNTDGSANSGAKYAFGYTFNEVDKAFYFVTPKLSTIDGNHSVDFYLGAVGGEDVVTTYEIGTLSDPTDATTFSEVGTPTALPMGVGQEGKPQYVNVTGSIPSTTDEYVAIKLLSSGAHTALYLDDFNWETTLSTEEFNSNSSFVAYPNPSLNKMVNLSLKPVANVVTITSVAGQVVYQANVSSSIQLNLQHLKSGMYLVTIASKYGIATKKLILN